MTALAGVTHYSRRQPKNTDTRQTQVLSRGQIGTKICRKYGAEGEFRTPDLLITNQLDRTPAPQNIPQFPKHSSWFTSSVPPGETSEGAGKAI